MTIASNKLSRRNVEKLLSPTVIILEDGEVKEVANTTSVNDIQLYIELSRRQSVLGRVDDVRYKEFMEILGCSKATFYNSLERLQRLEYIRAESDRKGCWDVTILNNVFATKADYKKSYMRTNVDFLYSDKFKAMSAVEKKICLYVHLNKSTHKKLEIYLTRLAKKIGIKILSVVQAALMNVAYFFPFEIIVGRQGDKICFKPSNVAKNSETETSNYIKHKLHTFCNRYKIKHTDQDVEDVAMLSGQYCNRLTLKQFMSCVFKVIFSSTTSKWLNPEYINFMCKMTCKRIYTKNNQKNNINHI